MDYKNTIITPKTDFPMKAGLPAREPGMLESWQKLDLYNALLEKNKDLPRLVRPQPRHDGLFHPLRSRLRQPRSAH